MPSALDAVTAPEDKHTPPHYYPCVPTLCMCEDWKAYLVGRTICGQFWVFETRWERDLNASPMPQSSIGLFPLPARVFFFVFFVFQPALRSHSSTHTHTHTLLLYWGLFKFWHTPTLSKSLITEMCAEVMTATAEDNATWIENRSCRYHLYLDLCFCRSGYII